MSSSNQFDATTILLLVLGAIVVLPLVAMGMGVGGTMGYGGTMGGYGTTSGWSPLVGILLVLLVLLVLLGGPLVFRRATERQESHSPVMEELHVAYAQGDLSDEEFETRRNALERSG